MVEGEDDLGRYVDKEISSSTLKDVPSRVNVVEVITWLRPVKEPQAYSFGKKIFLSFQPLGFVFYLEASFHDLYRRRPRGDEFHVLVTLPPLVHQFFYFTLLHPIHTHVNTIRVILGVRVLNRKYEMRLVLEDVLYAYSIKQHNLEKYYFVVDSKLLQLVTNLPITSKSKPQGNVLLFSA